MIRSFHLKLLKLLNKTTNKACDMLDDHAR